jgi:membrane protease YdiL (CAAX protease family)
LDLEPENTPIDAPIAVVQQEPGAAPREPFWGWLDFLMVIGLLVAMLVLILFSAAAATMIDPALKTDPVPLLFPTQLAFYLAIYIAFLLAFKIRYDKPVFSSLGWRRTVPNGTLLIIGVSGAILSIGVSGLATLLKTPEVRMDILDQLDKQPVILALFGLMAITIAPLFEELLFRGFLQPLFSRTLGVVGGILLTSVLFGALHAVQYKFVWQYVAAISLVGAVLGTVRYRTKSIISSTVMHACYNSVFVVGMLFQHK